MARKTFISYKYSEAKSLRDRILRVMGDDASFYQGETADSPDLTDTSTENIKRVLTDMMFTTSVTIVIISPNMISSKWIDWEIEYCLKEISRDKRTSKTNGIVGVIQNVNGSSDWLVEKRKNDDGCFIRRYDTNKLYKIITKNRSNLVEPSYDCGTCKTVNQLHGSYISLIDEDDFIRDPDKYIENAYSKSEKSDEYELTKQR